MATFKVGDRVRIVASHTNADITPFIGREGVVIRVEPDLRLPYKVRLPKVRLPGVNELPCLASELAPLTPPQADSWADAKVREVTKPVYTEPERVKERA